MATQQRPVECQSPSPPHSYKQTSIRFAKRMPRMPVSWIRELLKITEHPEIISFAGGMPAPELFPVTAIAEAHADVLRSQGPAALQYSISEGWRPLREWIAGRMQRKGIDASADRVLITSGSQQGIDLIAKVFLDAGDSVVVENPCYLAALQAFSGYEANFIAIDSDEGGMRVDLLENALQHSRPKLIYVVSEFSNPKGTTLTQQRRQKLIDLSARYQIPILEDNPYGELRYAGECPPSLAALDANGLVVHVSTFSKTLSPGMRLGWLVASDQVFQAVVVAKQAVDLHTNTLAQRVAARLLETLDYDGHVATLCNVYGERCTRMLSALERYFPSEIKWTRPDGGLFLWVELPQQLSADELFEEAIAERVAFVPGTSFFACEKRSNFMRLNFSNQNPEMIDEGIKRLANVVKRRLV
jgi:2-aminoadipate transaminase